MKAILMGIFAFTMMTTAAQAIPLSQSEKMIDFEVLTGQIKATYGPLEFKKQMGIADIDVLKKKYAKKIADSKNNRDFYYLLVEFIAEFHDGHFAGNLVTTATSRLPIFADLIAGKVLVDVVTDVVGDFEFMLEKGDEIVEINGRPAMEEVRSIAKYIGNGFDLSEIRYSTWLLFYRPARMLPMPTGAIKLKVRKPSGIERIVNLEWQTSGEALDENPDFHARSLARRGSAPIVNYDDFSSKQLEAFKDFDTSIMYMCAEGTRVAIPAEATIIMMEPIVAYYYPTAKGNVGYLRIPHYSPSGPAGDESELRFQQYEKAVKILNENTVGLVIDQDHNCGGSVSFLEELLGLFMDKPYSSTKFELRASKETYLEFSGWAKSVDPNTLRYDHALELVEMLKTSWIKGDYLTPRTSFLRRELYHPHHNRYTKPIVITIDEMSGSGGDAFPATLKGLGRATLVGTRTSGMGGHIGQLPPLPYSQMNVNITKSLFFRPDGVPVESNGAVPDHKYSHTYEDFMGEYVGYRKFYTEKILELVD